MAQVHALPAKSSGEFQYQDTQRCGRTWRRIRQRASRAKKPMDAPHPNLAVMVYADSNASDASDSNATARREPATARREPAFSDLH